MKYMASAKTLNLSRALLKKVPSKALFSTFLTPVCGGFWGCSRMCRFLNYGYSCFPVTFLSIKGTVKKSAIKSNFQTHPKTALKCLLTVVFESFHNVAFP